MVPDNKDTKTIEILLTKLDEYVKQLKIKRGQCKSLKEYIKNDELMTYIERKLQLAVQVCIDLGSHLISFYGWKSPENYREIFEIMAKEKVIKQDLVEILSEMVGFRNILVHGYLQLNPKIVYNILQNNLDDFDIYAKSIIDFMGLNVKNKKKNNNKKQRNNNH